MGGGRAGSDHRSEDWERSERIGFWVAIAIALLPIPAAILISWALGDPPWRSRPPRPAHGTEQVAPVDHEHR